jgi:hypothetical protein
VRRLVCCCLLASAALAGCGGDGDEGADAPRRDRPLTYRGTTSQDKSLNMVVDGRVRATLPVDLRCRDGSNTRVTVVTEPERPTLESDGSFYYSETGRSDFRGFGEGPYRAAVQGELQGTAGSGSASFRISFRETSCRANLTWRVRRR